ncbi:MAG: hydrolase [Candidatus Dormibacteraeota bacterium]|uniref:Hydrolase n=1 Tax=Candidatus Dormiibacter inghamiae TaxID=3127013 RepID=A0A934NDK6_9BACT|nr:hydrolase [Candidatus Dormibacteraeota bacterium]MBJ7606460.1 hydrolase [Candidatus Dormibacteraeota bacterium]
MARIICQQLAPQIADLAGNRRLSVEAIRAAVQGGADVVVLPELVTSGYVFESREEAASVAITPSHRLFAEWALAAARGPSVVVGGFCERGADGLLYNSAAMVDGSGVRAVYRKTHLWAREKLVFEPGAGAPPVLDTQVGRLGVLVCYDLEFPEMTRTLALMGADLIVVPTNWPLLERPPAERPPEVIIAMAAARTNRVFVACCDRVGVERGQEWTAGTAIIDQSGWVISTTCEAGPATADVDLALARRKGWSDLNDVLGDRRPELYSALSAKQTGSAQPPLTVSDRTASLSEGPARTG